MNQQQPFHDSAELMAVPDSSARVWTGYINAEKKPLWQACIHDEGALLGLGLISPRTAMIAGRLDKLVYYCRIQSVSMQFMSICSAHLLNNSSFPSTAAASMWGELPQTL